MNNLTKTHLHPLTKKITVSISGGQDSSFLLFYLSLLQSQLIFKCTSIWCNHFWQIDSFYTTLHLTKYALSFSSPLVGFLPFQMASSPSFSKTEATKYKKNLNFIKNKNKLIYTKGDTYTKTEQPFFTKQKSYKRKESATKICFLKQKFSLQSYLLLRALVLHHQIKVCKMNKIKTNSLSSKDFFVPFEEDFYNCKASPALTPYKWFASPCKAKPCKPYLRTNIGGKHKCKMFAKGDKLCTCNRGVRGRNEIFYATISKKQTFFFAGLQIEDLYEKSIAFRKAPNCTNVSSLTKLLFYKFYARQDLANFCSSFLCFRQKKRKSNLFSNRLLFQTKQCFIHIPCPPPVRRRREMMGQVVQIKDLYLPPSNANLKKPKAYKKAIKKLSETRSRNWRHIATERGCTFYGSNKCVYGHTLSDRVETILFNLIRGTGSKGVQSLPSKRRYSTFCYNKFYPVLEQVIKNTHIDLV